MKTADLQLQRSFWLLGSLMLIGGLLYWARPIFIPVTIALLLTFVLTPIVARMERRGIPRLIASTSAVLGFTLIVVGIVHFFALEMRSLTSELPAYKTQIAEKIGNLRQATAESWIVSVVDSVNEVINNSKTPPETETLGRSVAPRIDFSWLNVLQSIAGTAVEFVVNLVLVLMMALLMLMRREDLRNRLIHLLGADQLVNATRVINDASDRISRFLLRQLALNVGFGIVVVCGLYLIGIPYAYVWGALAGVLRYIPFLGGWAGAAFPILASLIMPSWTPFFLAASFFVVIELLQANLVEPQVYGHSIGVSAVGQLVALLFWASLWGPMGLILSTPLTACVCVLGRYYPGLRNIAMLIGDDEILGRPVAFYQRLVAGDMVEAGDLAEEFIKDRATSELIDAMLLPALLHAENDLRHGDLSKDEEIAITDAIREIFQDTVAPEASSVQNSDRNRDRERVLVVSLPFNDEIDELIIDMLRRTSTARVADWDSVAANHLQECNGKLPNLVVLATCRESHFVRIRGLCKAVRTLFPQTQILVGCWSFNQGVAQMARRLTDAGATIVCTTFQQAQCFINHADLARNDSPVV